MFNGVTGTFYREINRLKLKNLNKRNEQLTINYVSCSFFYRYFLYGCSSAPINVKAVLFLSIIHCLFEWLDNQNLNFPEFFYPKTEVPSKSVSDSSLNLCLGIFVL